ncbi:MAG: peptidoglycan DD-metalloendopeptidase family protein [Firmicutes bacterium]|nr:peptidoglycan DD-metalloendopeptidase family protein [Bacillota bacterium]
MTGSKRKADQAFTIMVVPHSGDKPVSFPFRTVWLKVAAAILGIALLSTCVFAVRYRYMTRVVGENDVELKQLRAENSSQKELLDKLRCEATEVEEKLNSLEALDNQIREIIKKERTLISSRSDPAAMSARSIEQRMALAEVSRSGAALRRQGLFEGLIEEARLREQSLTQALNDLQETVAFLRVKPSIWPTLGAVTSRFGFRRSPITRSRDFHEGLDIGAPYGAPVAAAGDGVVVYAGWHGGLGRTIIIDHGYGMRTWYGHCLRLAAKVGQKVERGQVIGQVGSSGSSTGPHLHFQLTLNGKCVDPEDFISLSGL